MFPTTVTLAVQWVDPETGLGRVVESVALSIIHVDGAISTPDPIEITPVLGGTGVTYVYTHSIVGRPGGHVRTMWSGTLGGDALPAKIFTVPFVPLGPRSGTKTVLRWPQPIAYTALHYKVEVWRDGLIEREVGFSTFPTIVDEWEFADEIDARSILYRVWAAQPTTAQSDGSNWAYVEVDASFVQSWRTTQSLCLVRDVIDGVDARPGLGIVIAFRTHNDDMPRRIGVAQAVNHTVMTPVTPFGELGVYLVRGALVDIGCEPLRLRGRFAVPDADTAKLSDLVITPRQTFSSPN